MLHIEVTYRSFFFFLLRKKFEKKKAHQEKSCQRFLSSSYAMFLELGCVKKDETRIESHFGKGTK